jgi:hypothetical protein
MASKIQNGGQFSMGSNFFLLLFFQSLFCIMFGLKSRWAHSCCRTIEMPEPTSLLEFFEFWAKKSNGGSLFHKAVDAIIGYGIKGP